MTVIPNLPLGHPGEEPKEASVAFTGVGEPDTEKGWVLRRPMKAVENDARVSDN